MFLAFFPFSEVVYIVAIFLAWIYIALGVIGNSHAAKDNVVLQPDLQVQETHVQIIKNNLSENRTCFWENHSILQVAIISKDIQLPLQFSKSNGKPIPFQDIFLSVCFNYILPNRAPPVA